MRIILILISSIFCLTSCKKYLDKKPSQSLVVPTSLADFQKLLDRPEITNSSTPGILELGSDDYYFTDQSYSGQSPVVRTSYIWNTDIWNGARSTDWENSYSIIYYANVVLEGLNDFSVGTLQDQNQWNTIYGHALYLRGITHYFLEEAFGQPFKNYSASTDLGIPVKTTANLAKKTFRSSVRDVYNQIISDLKQAAELLPNVSAARNRPSKAAAFGMLARAYLTMQDYSNAGMFADKSLQINSSLQNFGVAPLGSPATTASNPFPGPPNEISEVLYYSTYVHYGIPRSSIVFVDSSLLNSYSNNDYRKTIFFNFNATTNIAYYKGAYSALFNFSGPAVDEMYLIRAECRARANDLTNAINDINTLLTNRYKPGTYSNLPAPATVDDALNIILNERRKELIFRGIRWIDLRRLNQDSRFAKTLTRKLNGQTYTLFPNDKRYTYPIPDNEIQLSGIQQNPR